MQKRRFHSQNAGFEMSAPVDIGVKILAGTDVSPSCRSQRPEQTRRSYLQQDVVSTSLSTLVSYLLKGNP